MDNDTLLKVIGFLGFIGLLYLVYVFTRKPEFFQPKKKKDVDEKA